MANGYHQLGMLAQDRGDYAAAQAGYQRALTISERLGNQAGMAAGYGQLGLLAQVRGDYDAAQARYQQSLTINERLGNQAGVATNYSQLGNLRLDQQLPEEAVPYCAQALVIRARLGIPQVGNNVASLGQAHQELGDARTLTLLTDAVGVDAARQILDGLTVRPSDDGGASPEAH
jgi:tetratricopeptide (TPR) repeat protein